MLRGPSFEFWPWEKILLIVGPCLMQTKGIPAFQSLPTSVLPQNRKTEYHFHLISSKIRFSFLQNCCQHLEWISTLRKYLRHSSFFLGIILRKLFLYKISYLGGCLDTCASGKTVRLCWFRWSSTPRCNGVWGRNLVHTKLLQILILSRFFQNEPNFRWFYTL